MGVRVSAHSDRQRHLLQGDEGCDGRKNISFVIESRSKVKANPACLQIVHGGAKARQPCVQITDTRSIVVFDGLYPELKILYDTPRHSARTDVKWQVAVECETANSMFAGLVERFLVNGSRGAEDGQLASLYEEAVDFES